MLRIRNLKIIITLCSLTIMSALHAQNEMTISIDRQEKIEKIFNFLNTHPTQKGRQPPIYQQRLINEVDKYLQTNLSKYTTVAELKEFIAYMRANKYVYDPSDKAKKEAYKLAGEQYRQLRYDNVKQTGTEAAYIAFVEEFKSDGSTQLDEVGTLLALSRIRRALDASDFAGATRLVKTRIQALGDTQRVLLEVDDLVVRKLNGNGDAASVNSLISFMESNSTRTIQMPSLDRARVQYEQIKFDTAKAKRSEDALVEFIAAFRDYRSSAAAGFLRSARELLTSTGTSRVVAAGETAMSDALATRRPDYLDFEEIYEALADLRYRSILTGTIADHDTFLAFYQNKQEALNNSDKIRSLVSGIVTARQKVVVAVAAAKAAAQAATERAGFVNRIAEIRVPVTGLRPGEMKRDRQSAFSERFARPGSVPDPDLVFRTDFRGF